MPGAKTEAGGQKAKTAQPVCLYALLGVERGASAVELRKAYHVLARKTHPDKCPGDPDAVANFQALGRAYAILKDEGKRKRYDATGVDDDESEGFWSAYERYRGVQVSAADIDGFLASYRGGAEEEDDLMNALLVGGGDATRLLAEVMGSRDEDVPRYLAFYDAVLGGAPWGGAGGGGGGGSGGGGGGGASQGQKVLKKAQAKKLKKALAASRGHVMTLAELEAEAEAEGESVGGSDDEGEDDGEDGGEDEEGGAEMDDFIAPEGSESEAAAEEGAEEEAEEEPAPATAPPKRTQPKKAKKKQKPATGGSGGDMPASLLAMFAAKDASRQSGLDDFEARWAGGGGGGGGGDGSKKASKKRKK
jgi:curved DNA-binding protein CbpA